MSKNKTLIAIFTFSLDSKAAAALFKYFIKENLNYNIIFQRHGCVLDRGLPNPKYTDVELVIFGVNIADYGIYKDKVLIDIPLDGKTSACEAFYQKTQDMLFQDYFNPIPKHCLTWISLIKQFQVRNSITISDEVQAFNLGSTMYDTYPNSNSKSYFWDNLINDPEYIQFVLKNGKAILDYKRNMFDKISSYMSTWDTPSGDKCLLINRRDFDSLMFESFKGYEKYDFFIAYQDSYPKNEVDDISPIAEDNSQEHLFNTVLCNVVEYATMVFTVYRNNPNKKAIDFVKPFKGVGHDGVATFQLELSEFDSNDKNNIFESLLGNIEQHSESIFVNKPPLDSSVLKWINSQAKMLYKNGLRLFNSVTGKQMLFLNVFSEETDFILSHHIGVPPEVKIITYTYLDEAIIELLNSIIKENK